MRLAAAGARRACRRSSNVQTPMNASRWCVKHIVTRTPHLAGCPRGSAPVLLLLLCCRCLTCCSLGLQHRAAAAGHTQIVAYLLKHGVDPNCRKSKAKTPLHEAAAGGHGDVIEALLAQVSYNLFSEDFDVNTPVVAEQRDDWYCVQTAGSFDFCA